MSLGKNQTYDKKTGKVRMKDRTRSIAAKKAAKKRKGKPVSSATKNKIARALTRVHKTGKTKAGRKAKLAA